MAIVGLTDQAAAFPIIGVLRKGDVKPTNGNRPGKDLTYFRFTSEDSEALSDFYQAYTELEDQRRINIFLPHKTADENMDAWMEQWVAGGLVHRCDGKVTRLWRTDDGSYSDEPKPCPGGCKQVGRLSVIIPELGRFATVTVLTTSIHDIINLTRQLKSYVSIRGDLRGIPFVLTRTPKLVSTPGNDGKRVRREKWLLSIEANPEWAKRQLLADEHEAMPELPDTIESPGYSMIGETIDLPANIIAPDEDFSQPEQPKTNGNGDKLPVGKQKFWDTVQKQTDGFFRDPDHLEGTTGWPSDWNDNDSIDAAISAAIDFAHEHRQQEFA